MHAVGVSGLVADVWERVPETFRRIPRLFLECDFAWEMKDTRGKTVCPRLGLEVPDILVPDVGDQPSLDITCSG